MMMRTIFRLYMKTVPMSMPRSFFLRPMEYAHMAAMMMKMPSMPSQPQAISMEPPPDFRFLPSAVVFSRGVTVLMMVELTRVFTY